MRDALTRRVLEEAQRFYGCVAAPAPRSIKPIDCAYSSVCRIDIDCDGILRVLYLKRVKTAGIDAEQAARRVLSEHRILAELSEHFRPLGTWHTPRPVAVFPEEGALITEAVPGTPLMDVIGKFARRTTISRRHAALERYCAMSGRWLREFQSFTDRGSGSFNFDGLREYCARRLEDLATDPRSGIDGAFKGSFLRYLELSRERSGDRPDRIVGRHNDFSPHNILVEGEHFSVIDFGFFDHDSHLYDVCKFWFQLERMKASPLYTGATIERLQRSFFEGYGTGIDLADPAFEMIASRYFVTHLVTLIKEGMRRGPRGWVDRRSYERCLAWLAERRAQA